MAALHSTLTSVFADCAAKWRQIARILTTGCEMQKFKIVKVQKCKSSNSKSLLFIIELDTKMCHTHLCQIYIRYHTFHFEQIIASKHNKSMKHHILESPGGCGHSCCFFLQTTLSKYFSRRPFPNIFPRTSFQIFFQTPLSKYIPDTKYFSRHHFCASFTLYELAAAPPTTSLTHPLTCSFIISSLYFYSLDQIYNKFTL